MIRSPLRGGAASDRRQKSVQVMPPTYGFTDTVYAVSEKWSELIVSMLLKVSMFNYKPVSHCLTVVYELRSQRHWEIKWQDRKWQTNTDRLHRSEVRVHLPTQVWDKNISCTKGLNQMKRIFNVSMLFSHSYCDTEKHKSFLWRKVSICGCLWLFVTTLSTPRCPPHPATETTGRSTPACSVKSPFTPWSRRSLTHPTDTVSVIVSEQRHNRRSTCGVELPTQPSAGETTCHVIWTVFILLISHLESLDFSFSKHANLSHSVSFHQLSSTENINTVLSLLQDTHHQRVVTGARKEQHTRISTHVCPEASGTDVKSQGQEDDERQ